MKYTTISPKIRGALKIKGTQPFGISSAGPNELAYVCANKRITSPKIYLSGT
jgi:hypothetical protein